jgi:hypothetical protein
MANVVTGELSLIGFLKSVNSDVTTKTNTGEVKLTASTQTSTFTPVRLTFDTATPTVPAPTAIYSATATILTTANLDLDFFGGTMTDVNGVAIVWTKLHGLIVSVVSPDGAKKVLVGPQAVSNAVDLDFTGVASDDWVPVYWVLPMLKPSAAGWTVDATHKNVRVNNPTAGSVSVEIVAFGKP